MNLLKSLIIFTQLIQWEIFDKVNIKFSKIITEKCDNIYTNNSVRNISLKNINGLFRMNTSR